MDYKAIHRYADVTARKLRPFATLIRGRFADEALELLRFLPNKRRRLLEAVLKQRPSATRRIAARPKSKNCSSRNRALMAARS